MGEAVLSPNEPLFWNTKCNTRLSLLQNIWPWLSWMEIYDNIPISWKTIDDEPLGYALTWSGAWLLNSRCYTVGGHRGASDWRTGGFGGFFGQLLHLINWIGSLGIYFLFIGIDTPWTVGGWNEILDFWDKERGVLGGGAAEEETRSTTAGRWTGGFDARRRGGSGAWMTSQGTTGPLHAVLYGCEFQETSRLQSKKNSCRSLRWRISGRNLNYRLPSTRTSFKESWELTILVSRHSCKKKEVITKEEERSATMMRRSKADIDWIAPVL